MTVTPPPGSPAGSAATEAFARHRELLFGVVYGILGTVATPRTSCGRPGTRGRAVRRRVMMLPGPRACLLRAALRQALAPCDAIARRREAYIGPWLPEPLVCPLERATGPGADGRPAEASTPGAGARAVPLATLAALDDLTALERAVFVLAEVARCAPEQIAEIVGRSPASVRQLAGRAADRVEARRPRSPADRRSGRRSPRGSRPRCAAATRPTSGGCSRRR